MIHNKLMSVLRIVNRGLEKSYYYVRRLRKIEMKQDGESLLYLHLENLFREYSTEKPTISSLYVNKETNFSWVGGQYKEGYVFGIPNGEGKYLQINCESGEIRYFGNLSKEAFKWTGGGEYKGDLYGFPRTSDKLLKIHTQKHLAEQIDIGIRYGKEHHYGGVLIENGMIYQPPRDTNHILAINCNTYSSHRIRVFPPWEKQNARYCGSIQHPNGLVYFLPEKNARVICFNPKTEHYSFIGDYLDCMCFGGIVYSDGNIYGFSAYSRGILKIDTKNNTSEMIHREVDPKCYGTQLGINGKLYGIPGDGDVFWEFDPRTDEVKTIAKTQQNGINAKCAGGTVDIYGNIYCIPAFGDRIYKIGFDNNERIKHILYKTYFKNNY